MKAFSYEAPESEAEVVELLAAAPHDTVLLAGGTDLVGLMQRMLVTPERVVSLDHVSTLRAIEADSQQARIGAMVTLEEILDSADLQLYTALKQSISAISSQQLQAQGTLGGELCQQPRCWYFRSGRGLLAEGGRLVEEGDNRFHAILGNDGPAKFVSASRVAPALIALGASVRIVGSEPNTETIVPLERFFHTPGKPLAATTSQLLSDTPRRRLRQNILEADQFISHIILPPVGECRTASYEVQHGSGADYPLVAAAASLSMERGRVVDARIVMGHVAPVPWLSQEAATALIGRAVDHSAAEAAGAAAVAEARPLSGNAYKVDLARVAVKRAILLAAGFETGGF